MSKSVPETKNFNFLPESNTLPLLQSYVPTNGGPIRPDGGQRVVRTGQRAVRVPHQGRGHGAQPARTGSRAHRAHAAPRAPALTRDARTSV